MAGSLGFVAMGLLGVATCVPAYVASMVMREPRPGEYAHALLGGLDQRCLAEVTRRLSELPSKS